MYVLSTTVGYYFEIIHNIRIENSNALSLLQTLQTFKKIHLEYKDQFKPFRGVHFNTILEMINKSIDKLEKSHHYYINQGYILTEETKQYDIYEKTGMGVVPDLKMFLNSVDLTVRQSVIKGVGELFLPQKKEKSEKIKSNMERKNLKKIINK